MSDEARIEAEIQAKGLNAPRLTPDHIDACIAAEALGRDIARRNAREQIWGFEGYLLRERLAGA